MKTPAALSMLSALSGETRLAIFRTLVARGGLAAGDLGAHLKMPASTLSFHLKDLRTAGLIKSERQGRTIIYAADVKGLGDLLAFLSQDCCGGHPELCLPDLAAACKPTPRKTA